MSGQPFAIRRCFLCAALDPAALDPAALDPAALDPAVLDPGALDPAALDPAVSQITLFFHSLLLQVTRLFLLLAWIS